MGCFVSTIYFVRLLSNHTSAPAVGPLHNDIPIGKGAGTPSTVHVIRNATGLRAAGYHRA